MKLSSLLVSNLRCKRSRTKHRNVSAFRPRENWDETEIGRIGRGSPNLHAIAQLSHGRNPKNFYAGYLPSFTKFLTNFITNVKPWG